MRDLPAFHETVHYLTLRRDHQKATEFPKHDTSKRRAPMLKSPDQAILILWLASSHVEGSQARPCQARTHAVGVPFFSLVSTLVRCWRFLKWTEKLSSDSPGPRLYNCEVKGDHQYAMGRKSASG